jgi:hydroxymethylpyrimidine/phosphomethylpyrimidine kinase
VTPPVLLTVAGSDSGGGAGIQADLKTFAALGAYGASVITAVTAQNTRGVRAIHPVPADVVAAQLDAVLDDLPVAGIKIGMIGTVEAAEAIAAIAGQMTAARAEGAARAAEAGARSTGAGARPPGPAAAATRATTTGATATGATATGTAATGAWGNLVVDPVLVSTSGSRLGVAAVVRPLLAYTRVLTPNRDEAGALLGRRVSTVEEMADAAVALVAAGPRAVVVTGSELAVDVLHHDGRTHILRRAPVRTRNNHGSGCTFAAAIAVRLAAGDPVPEAVRKAKEYVTDALGGARAWQLGGGPGPLHHFTRRNA